MGIKAKLLLAFIALFALLGGLSSWLLDQRVLANYRQVEQNAAFIDMDRVVGTLETEMEALRNIVGDWGDGDDLYRYVVDRNPAFYQSNLKRSSYSPTHNHWLGIFDRQGRTVATIGVDPASGKALDFSDLERPDSPYRAFLTLPAAPSPASCGLLKVRLGLMLACRWPIRTSQHQGPEHGSIVMGRLLNADMLNTIRGRARFNFTVEPFNPATLAEPVLPPQRIYSRLGIQPVHYQATRDTLLLHWPLYDMLGRPQGQIRLVWPRTIMQQGHLVVRQTGLLLVALAGMITLALAGVVQWLLVRRLTRLETQVHSLHAGRLWHERVSEGSRDEIGSLGRHVNKLLDLIEAQIGTLERLSLTDPLTGTANRRAFDTLLLREVLHHHRSGSPLCLLLIDVDHFKLYNDAYGHAAGDQVLVVVAECLQAAAQRGTDLVARIGGEEFAALLPETSVEGARKVAEAMRQNLAERALPHEGSLTSNYVTLSIGIALLDEDDDPASLFHRADIGLYGAKGTGRDRAVFKVGKAQNTG